MLQKNIERQNRKNRAIWLPYYQRITKNKKVYCRKDKHRVTY